MKSRVAVISIILEDVSSVEKLNSILSKYRERIIGRMGLPYREKNVNIICVAVDAPEDEINSMTGQIGRLNGVSAKTNYSNVMSELDG
jgi:putative iron-only hydrogenase system regulator